MSNIRTYNRHVIQPLQGVLDAVENMKESEMTDGWVPANHEMFRMFLKVRKAVAQQAERNGMTIPEIAEGMKIPVDEVIELLAEPVNLPVDTGMIVRSKNPDGDPLHCGSGTYGAACVVSMEPFVMVSLSADMRWGSWSADRVEAVEKASPEQLEKCMTRLEK